MSLVQAHNLALHIEVSYVENADFLYRLTEQGLVAWLYPNLDKQIVIKIWLIHTSHTQQH